MRDEMTGLEIISLVTELKSLVGTKIQKIYHNGDEVLLHLYSAKTKEKILRIVPGSTVHLTDYKRDHPTYPTHFCMYLRKYLNGGVIRYVIQPATERIIKIGLKTDKEYVLIIELFSKGNVILCEGDTIMQPLKVQVWKDRSIKPKERYSLPPAKANISTIKMNELNAIIDATQKDDIVRCLATDLGLGGPYAEECCKRAKVLKSRSIEDLTSDEIRRLHTSLVSMIQEARKPRGEVVFKGTPLDVVPIEMEIYATLTKKNFPTFNEALDFYFINYVAKEMEKVDELSSRKKQMEHRLRTQKAVIEEYKEEAEKSRRFGETMKTNLHEIKRVCNSLLSAREHYSWSRIMDIIESEKQKGIPEAMLIKEIKPDEGTVVLDTEPEIEMPFTSEPADVMDDFYTQAKKFEAKIESARNFVVETEKQIEKLSEEKPKETGPEKIERGRKEWFESYRWFKSSEGFLVVSGKDATQNEVIIKKYMDPGDLVFHADIQGSPFSILKNGREAGQKTIFEAAKQTAIYSKSWAMGYGSADVYYVQPYQVTKQAQPGEYIPHGSFMIRGKKNYVKDLKLELAIGISKEFKVIAGPKEAISKQARHLVSLVPGDTATGTMAKEVRAKLVEHVPEIKTIPLEDFQKFIPGSSRMVRS